MTIGKDGIIGIVGAGAMGAGIAQVAAQAGHDVLLFDGASGAASRGRARIGEGLDALIAKGKFAQADKDALLARIMVVDALDSLAPCAVVIEAIVEDIAAKRGLFLRLEALLGENAILATNTSSISVTAIARDLKRPAQCAGMHFFNPAPVMKLVEIVSGLATAKPVADALFELAQSWGKTAVHARSTPGFIVNRIARPFYAEALALLHEKRAKPAAIDACLRGAGFKMGPCELMDFIGHDVNFAVTQSVFAANFFDRRYAPNPVQQELVDAGRLGRKTGQGFYTYNERQERKPSRPPPEWPPFRETVAVFGKGWVPEHMANSLRSAGATVMRDTESMNTGLRVGALGMWMTDGERAVQRHGRDREGEHCAVFDLPLAAGGALAMAFAPETPHNLRQDGLTALAAGGFVPLEIADSPGLIVARTVAMLINEAADAVQQGVCTVEAANAAMRLGVAWPAGPFQWLDMLGVPYVDGVLQWLAAATQSERYRVSPWLQDRLWAS
jgi:3-hydroxybutyryl-CoA dehydrogenase